MNYKFFTILSVLLLSACTTTKTISLAVNELPPTAADDGGIELQMWKSIGGKNVRALTRNARFPLSSSSSELVQELDFIDSKGDKYGQRLRGLLMVPESGAYTFWLSADESAEVWLSGDDTPDNKRLIAFVNKPSGYKIWDRYKTQKSPTINLDAGTPYYFEVLHKDHLGGDYLNVSWSGPGFELTTLTSENLAYYDHESGLAQSYQDGYHVGYHSGNLLSPYDNRYLPIDSDNDGLPNFYELAIGTDPNDDADAFSDSDGDLLSNVDEYFILSNPLDEDTDKDGIPDGYEVLVGLNVLDSSDALNDNDGDGSSNLDEYLAGTQIDNASSVPELPSTPDSGGQDIYAVQLNWSAPNTREDGSVLSQGDIKSYKIYRGASSGNMVLLITVTDPEATSVALESLSAGTHYFAISTVTKDNSESKKSSIVEVNI